MNRISIGIVAASAMIILAGCSTTSTTSDVSIVGKTFKGNWDDTSSNPSSLKIVNDTNVRYCFRGDCTTQPYSGDPSRSIRFKWGNSNFTFNRNGDTSLKGFFRTGSNRSTVDMSL